MGVKPKPDESNMSHLNALIPAELHRRLMIAKANTGKTIQELVADALALLLDKVEAPPKSKAK